MTLILVSIDRHLFVYAAIISAFLDFKRNSFHFQNETEKLGQLSFIEDDRVMLILFIIRGQNLFFMLICSADPADRRCDRQTDRQTDIDNKGALGLLVLITRCYNYGIQDHQLFMLSIPGYTMYN